VLDFFFFYSFILSLSNFDFVILYDLFDFDRSTISLLFWLFFFDICGVVDWIISFVWNEIDLRNGCFLFSGFAVIIFRECRTFDFENSTFSCKALLCYGRMS
jgi:hypothetical protein